ncbi:DUF7848 domain-containing protein [Streptomyces blattellae]|uniref:DUF7848 domain-containing protein n=1 Tax=Streptomyces blattellae TaxID=2569855 RepID=UPI0012B9CA74|nr:hypothetical protein [Streptomyces blattellae]
MSRAVYRYVAHTIQHAPEGGITAELFCTSIGCGESSGPQGDPETPQDWALRHTGLYPGHNLFRREYTDHARVTRADPTPAR